MGKLIEGLWDCKYCKTAGISGSKRECPNCGKPRDKDTKFYMPGKITYVAEEEASKINCNPDWICPYCNSLNSASYTTCQSCGSERTFENLDYFTNKKSKECEDSNDTYEGKTELSESFTEKFKQEPSRVASRCMGFIEDRWKQILIIFSIVAVIIGLIYIFIPNSQEITINSFSWERSIEIEKYQTVDESGWSLPEGAQLHNSKLEIYTYEQVLDYYETKSKQVAKQRISGYEEYVVGYRDLGNGYFEEITSQKPIYETYYETEYYQEPVYRSEPVYKTKYYYEIDKWLYDRTLRTSGDDKTPYWEEVSTLKEDERVSNKKEKYYVNGITQKGNEKQISIPYEEWTDLKVGETIKINVSIFGNGKLT